MPLNVKLHDLSRVRIKIFTKKNNVKSKYKNFDFIRNNRDENVKPCRTKRFYENIMRV